jgi:hypothetical protein
MLGKIFRFLNKDLTGRTWESRATHPYFGEMVYFGNKDESRAYWEISNLTLPGTDNAISIYLKGTEHGLTADEERFCHELIGRHAAFATECLPVIDAELQDRRSTAVITAESMRLESFEVPEDGDRTKPWEATFSVQTVDGLFTVEYVDGEPIGARFDD